MFSIKGQVALVTGGAVGIGQAIAIGLARAGADVAIVAPSADVHQTQQAVEAAGRRFHAVRADLMKPESAARVVGEVEAALGPVDILVNNAGITRDNLILRMSEEDWDAVVDSNLKGTFLCTKAVARIMLKQKSGKIVNIASVMGIVGNAGQANYSASKAGIIALTKTTAKELGSRGITVNAVAPGFIQTVMTDALPDELREQMKKQVPLARLGTADDVARVVLFLSTDDSAYVTGQVISVDGGLFM